MTTIKLHTDLEQSKKLAEILPIESADMRYDGVMQELNIPKVRYNGLGTPCWSLAALLSVLPMIIGDVFSENALRLRMDKGETNFNVWYENLGSGMVEEGLDIIKSNPVDACYEMILKLHELNLL